MDETHKSGKLICIQIYVGIRVIVGKPSKGLDSAQIIYAHGGVEYMMAVYF